MRDNVHDLSHVAERRVEAWEIPILKDKGRILAFLHAEPKNGSPLGQVLHTAHQAHFILHLCDQHLLGGYDVEKEQEYLHVGSFSHIYCYTSVTTVRDLGILQEQLTSDWKKVSDPTSASPSDLPAYVYKLRKTLVQNLLSFKKLKPRTPDEGLLGELHIHQPGREPEWLEKRYAESRGIIITARAVQFVYRKMLEILEPILIKDGYPTNGERLKVDYHTLAEERE